jgi:hypothetical protein
VSDSTREYPGFGLGYTLATGRLFCDVAEFHGFAEKLLGRPIFTHEFGDQRTWDEMRERYEALVVEFAASSFSAGGDNTHP